MSYQNNSEASHSTVEDVAAGSQNQQRARSRRRRRRQLTSEQQEMDQARALQVYRFRSRAPSTSMHGNSEASLGPSRVPAPTEDGKIMEMLARSASYWAQQEPARCWVRDCTGLDCSGGRHLLQHYLLAEEDSLASLIREELFSTDEGNDGNRDNTATNRSQADVQSDGAPRSFAEEYSLAPVNTRKKYSAQNFDKQVEEYFKRL